MVARRFAGTEATAPPNSREAADRINHLESADVEDGGQDSAATGFAPGESPERGGLARRAARNFAGLAAGNALQCILVLMLAHGLGQHDAGIFFESFAAVRLLAVLAAFGLDVTAIRQVSVAHARDEATGHVIRLAVMIAGSVSLAATVVVFAAAPLAAD